MKGRGGAMEEEEEEAAAAYSNSLTQPLLSHKQAEAQPGHASSSSSFLGLDWKEVKLQLELAGSMILVSATHFLLPLISVMFVGHLGELALSGVSLATSFANVTGISLLMGMANALETLCGQAYGARQYHWLGLHVQRAVFILILTSIPIANLWASMGKWLLLLGQDPHISHMAGQYALWLIPTLYVHSFLQPLIKFLQAQTLVSPMLFCSAMTICLHVPLCWLMVYKAGLGYQGAALATSISNFCNMGALLLFVGFSKKCEKTWVPFSWDALHDWKPFIMLAIPSALMVCLEWWCYEILVLLSGLLPNPQLSTYALSVCLNTSSLAYIFPAGLSAAVSTRVSNELGAGSPAVARHAVYVSDGLSLLEALAISFILLSVRNIWGLAFSNEEEVILSVATLMCLLSVSTVVESITTILGGVARGCGWQKLGAFANLGAYYVVGLPCLALGKLMERNHGCDGAEEEEEEGECTACLCSMERRDEVRRLPHCRHVFHRECIQKWVDHEHRTCPLCRSSLLVEELPSRQENREFGHVFFVLTPSYEDLNIPYST